MPAIQRNLKRASGSGNAIKAFPDSATFLPAIRNESIVTKRTKTEISLEFEEEVAIRAHRISLADCPACNNEVLMIPANDAALITKVRVRQVYELVNSGILHFTEDRFGLLYICSESLRNLRRVEPHAMAKAADPSTE